MNELNFELGHWHPFKIQSLNINSNIFLYIENPNLTVLLLNYTTAIYEHGSFSILGQVS